MGSQWWTTDWAGMSLTKWHEKYTGGTHNPTQLPPITYLMENPGFRNHYLDAAACLLNERFNPVKIARFTEVHANQILPALYLESARGENTPVGQADPRFDGRAFNLRVSSALKWRAARIEQEYYDELERVQNGVGNVIQKDILFEEAEKAWNLVKHMHDDDDDSAANAGLSRIWELRQDEYSGDYGKWLRTVQEWDLGVAREDYKLKLPGDLGNREPHTQGKYNLNEVYYQGLAGDPYLDGRGHRRDGQKILGIIDYVQMRYDRAWDQLRATGRTPEQFGSDRCEEILTREHDGEPLPF
jgi:hypothetical protein